MVDKISDSSAPGWDSSQAFSRALSANSDTAKYAPLAVMAGATPQLVEEAGAWKFSLKEIARQKSFKKMLKSLPVAAGAFGTYLGGALGAAAGVYGLNKWVHANFQSKYELMAHNIHTKCFFVFVFLSFRWYNLS